MAGKKVIIIGAGRAGLSTGIYALWLQIDTFYGLTFYLRRPKRIDITLTRTSQNQNLKILCHKMHKNIL
jgi:thioredoxin reductase